jgi:hypothetical protein
MGRAVSVACLAAALALESVPNAAAGHGYLATRAGHASSIALLAVALADAGFVDDPQSLATLESRLRVPARTGRVEEGRLARLAIELLERSVG